MKSRANVRILSLVLMVAMLLMLISACGSTSTTSEAASSSSEVAAVSSVEQDSAEVSSAEPIADETSEPVPAEEAASIDAPSDIEEPESAEEEPEEPEEMASLVFPISDGEELSLFYYYPPFVTDYVDDVSETSFFQQMEKLTGVKINFQSVILFAADENFQLMVASGDYTDMVYGFGGSYKLGLDNAIEDDIIFDLTPFIENGSMPSYGYLLDEVPARKINAMTDAGYIPVAAQMLSSDYMPNAGMVVRQDFLDAVGMESPETYTEWEDVLSAFKNELNVPAPLNIPAGASFFGDYVGAGFGVSTQGLGIFVQDGTVKAGVLEDGYRDWVELLNDWYSKGLIYNDFYSQGAYESYPDSGRVLANEIGIWYVDVDTMGEYEKSTEDPNFKVRGVSDPVQNPGDVNHLRKYSDADANLINLNNGVAITTACKNPELAAQWLDAHYSPEGSLIVNYGGLEGETFNYDENGHPVLGDLVLNNPDMVFNHALSFYCAKNYVGYYEYSRVSDIFTDAQREATEIWAKADSSYGYPVNAYMTAEETTTYAQYSSDLTTYISEHLIKFIIGDEPLSDFEEFRQTLLTMGIEDVIAVKQAAYDRYSSRG